MKNFIVIRGAREHNLKNINVDIPRNKLVVITGLSGSGKSSLAFDTLYAEGQRRYVESLSTYARQFLELMPKPDVDLIEGLCPAIAIEQKTTSNNPRSTVGTVTELYDYLRLLYARIGVAYSPVTGKPIEAQTPTQIIDRILDFPKGSRWHLLSVVIKGRKGEYKKEIQEFKKQGYQRLKIDGKVYEIDQIPPLSKRANHDIAVVVDRLVIQEDHETLRLRLANSVETALGLSQGVIELENVEEGAVHVFSTKFSCPESDFTLTEIEPRLFSFNSPQGACPICFGLGFHATFTPQTVIQDPTLAVIDAITPWTTEHERNIYSNRSKDIGILSALCKVFDVPESTTFGELPKSLSHWILYGCDVIDNELKNSDLPKTIATKIRKAGAKILEFEGVIPSLTNRYRSTQSESLKELLRPFVVQQPCAVCKGYRLKKEVLCIKINNKHIGQVCDLSIEGALQWFEGLTLSPKHQEIAGRILKEIISRLGFLTKVGLTYLSLSRQAGTLSGGESQRIRLASQVGSALTGVLYVLDEPSIGLHQRDNDRLLQTLENLRDLGNTVVVVEHDEDAMKMADWIIDMGPKAGTHGGHIVAQGTATDLMADPKSVTGQYLSGEQSIPFSQNRRLGNGHVLRLCGARANNLKNIDVNFPLGVLTCVTGVSGGGKSSLVVETLFKALGARLHAIHEVPGPHDTLEGLHNIDKVIDIDQSPIGRTPRSNPATYVGCFTAIREWFTQMPEARSRGYLPGRFSFNVKGGRCEACQGDGVTRISMHFLPDVYVQCDQCHGKRYNRETLDIYYNGKNISDVLDLTVEDALEFFKKHKDVATKLRCLHEVGLGYIHVGQQATTLSGGEAQRIKLAKELSKRATGRTVYILDEPTTGLHFDDIKKLLEVLHRLVDQGNTVIVIEHNLDVIKTADWIIDIGPEGGDGGGRIVACGTPEQVAQVTGSHTGRYLKDKLGCKNY